MTNELQRLQEQLTAANRRADKFSALNETLTERVKKAERTARRFEIREAVAENRGNPAILVPAIEARIESGAYASVASALLGVMTDDDFKDQFEHAPGASEKRGDDAPAKKAKLGEPNPFKVGETFDATAQAKLWRDSPERAQRLQDAAKAAGEYRALGGQRHIWG